MTSDMNSQIRDLRDQVGLLSGRVRDHDVLLADQEKISAALTQVRADLEELADRFGDEESSKGYRPAPNPTWWDLDSEDQAAELERLRAWLDDIAAPFLGTKGFPSCLLEHGPVLLLIDAAAEAWKVLWLPEKRTKSSVGAQCEYLTRIWPAIRAEVQRLTGGCDHQSGLAALAVRSAS